MGVTSESNRQVWRRRVVWALGVVLVAEVVGMVIDVGVLSDALIFGPFLVFAIAHAATVPIPLGAPPRLAGWNAHLASCAPMVAYFPAMFWLTLHTEALSWLTLTATLVGFAAVVAVFVSVLWVRRRRARARAGALVALHVRPPSPQRPNTGSMGTV